MNASKTRLELRTREVGPWPMNTFVLVCPTSGESVLVDPGAEPETLAEMLEGSQPVGILLTHTHPDHVGALEEMRGRLNVRLMAHPGPHYGDKKLNAERHLKDGDRVQIGVHSLRVFAAPGHIDDQICLLFDDDNRAIVGDTIFEGGPGATWTVSGFRTTLQTLREVILPWPDDTVCYPGHGPHFRLGDQRVAIESFLAKEHGDFYGDATWEM